MNDLKADLLIANAKIKQLEEQLSKLQPANEPLTLVPGITDRTGQPLRVGDEVYYRAFASQDYRGIIRFGEYEQDGSGGEYGSSKCIGFYIERLSWIPQDWRELEDEEYYMPVYEKTISLCDAKWIEFRKPERSEDDA